MTEASLRAFGRAPKLVLLFLLLVLSGYVFFMFVEHKDPVYSLWWSLSIFAMVPGLSAWLTSILLADHVQVDPKVTEETQLILERLEQLIREVKPPLPENENLYDPGAYHCDVGDCGYEFTSPIPPTGRNARCPRHNRHLVKTTWRRRYELIQARYQRIIENREQA